jgi:hypothetical protein
MKQFLQGCVICSLLFTAFQASALTDTYFATGEDLDFLIESDNTLGIQEIEYELRKFVFFRKIEDYLYNLSSDYPDELN